MKAILKKSPSLKQYSIGHLIEFDREEIFHLVNVLRLKKNEKFLMLDGNGTIYELIAQEMSKKQLIAKIDHIRSSKKKHFISVGMGIPRKEAYGNILKNLVEIGVESLLPIQTEFAQVYNQNLERDERLIESAMIQSNNPFMLQVKKVLKLDEIEYEKFDHVVCFSNEMASNLKNDSIGEFYLKKVLVLFGPEGGFSPEENKFLQSLTKIHFVHLPTYILKLPTAISTGIGYLMGVAH